MCVCVCMLSVGSNLKRKGKKARSVPEILFGFHISVTKQNVKVCINIIIIINAEIFWNDIGLVCAASEESSSVAEGAAAEDEDCTNDSESEDTELQKAKQALTGRGVTLSDLMEDGIIQAGENILSIDYRVY